MPRTADVGHEESGQHDPSGKGGGEVPALEAPAMSTKEGMGSALHGDLLVSGPAGEGPDSSTTRALLGFLTPCSEKGWLPKRGGKTHTRASDGGRLALHGVIGSRLRRR